MDLGGEVHHLVHHLPEVEVGPGVTEFAVGDSVYGFFPDGSGTRVDMRSASRVGVSDLGKNAARIRAYFATLKAG